MTTEWTRRLILLEEVRHDTVPNDLTGFEATMPRALEPRDGDVNELRPVFFMRISTVSDCTYKRSALSSVDCEEAAPSGALTDAGYSRRRGSSDDSFGVDVCPRPD